MHEDRRAAEHFEFPDIFGLSFTVLRCDNCRLRRLDPIPTPKQYEIVYGDRYFSDQPGSAEGIDYERNRPDRIRIYRQKLKRLEHWAPSARTLIDIGAGDGDFLNLCRKRYDIRGIELSHYAVQQAKREFGIAIDQGSSDAITKFKRKFDIIHMHHVFEHLPDPIQFLQQVQRCMHERTIFLFEVPHQFEELNHILKNLVGRPSYQKGLYAIHHPFFYTQPSLKRLLQSSGFDILNMTSCPVEKSYYVIDPLIKRLGRVPLFLLQKLTGRGPVIEVICKISPAHSAPTEPVRQPGENSCS
jgi:SAM-dependent methyltransferase